MGKSPGREAVMAAQVGALALSSVRITKLVTHKSLDLDAWMCYWLVKRYLPQAVDAELVLVNSGTSFEGTEGDPSVITFDTGGGEFDHHNKGVRREVASAHLVATALGVNTLPELQVLLNLALAVDRADTISPTDINYQIVGWTYRLRNPSPGTPAWNTLREQVFTMFDIVRDQEAHKAKTRSELVKPGAAIWLDRAGVRICILYNRPQLRGAAFENGADVVVWSKTENNGKYIAGVQVNRTKRDRIRLSWVAARLRAAEAKAREVNVDGYNLTYLGQGQPVPTWYLDQSLSFVLAGSQTHTPTAEEYTRLTPRQIADTVIDAFAEMRLR